MFNLCCAVAKALTALLGEGLLVAEGDVHKRQRRIITPSFAPANLRAMTPIIQAKARELRDIWGSRIDAGSKSSEREKDEVSDVSSKGPSGVERKPWPAQKGHGAVINVMKDLGRL